MIGDPARRRPPAGRPLPVSTALLFPVAPLAVYAGAALVLGERRAPLAIASARAPSSAPGALPRSRARRFGSSRRTARRRKRPSPNAPRRRRGSIGYGLGRARRHWSRRSGTPTSSDGPRQARRPGGRRCRRGTRSGRGRNALWSAWRSRPLRCWRSSASAWRRVVGATLVEHRVAYAYIVPAMLGDDRARLLPLPLRHRALLHRARPSTTPVSRCRDLWVGLENYRHILGDFAIAKRAADGLSRSTT